MGIFSLNWFKSERQRKLEELEIEEKILKNKLLERQLHEVATPPPSKDEKEQVYPVPEEPASVSLFRRVMLINNNLTIIWNDGSTSNKTGCSEEDYREILKASSTAEILLILKNTDSPIQYESKEEEEALQERKNIIKSSYVIDLLSKFEKRDDAYYIKGINRSIPPLLLTSIAEIAERFRKSESEHWEEALYDDVEFNSLIRFFSWCCLNKRPEVVRDLYGFLKKNSFRITKQGFFVALRNVVSMNSYKENELVAAISNAYQKIRTVWKQNPEKYILYQTLEGDYGITKSATLLHNHIKIGNVSKLYHNLPEMEENRYTDAHTRTFDIRVGRVVSMPPEQCSWSTADCAEAGLHFTADHIHYVGCGNTSVLVLINPMKVVGIGEYKGRCYEYLPIMTVSTDESTEILHDLDFDTLELDESYAIHELNSIEEHLASEFVSEEDEERFRVPRLSPTDKSNLTSILDNLREEVSKRIVSVS